MVWKIIRKSVAATRVYPIDNVRICNRLQLITMWTDASAMLSNTLSAKMCCIFHANRIPHNVVNAMNADFEVCCCCHAALHLNVLYPLHKWLFSPSLSFFSSLLPHSFHRTNLRYFKFCYRQKKAPCTKTVADDWSKFDWKTLWTANFPEMFTWWKWACTNVMYK